VAKKKTDFQVFQIPDGHLDRSELMLFPAKNLKKVDTRHTSALTPFFHRQQQRLAVIFMRQTTAHVIKQAAGHPLGRQFPLPRPSTPTIVSRPPANSPRLMLSSACAAAFKTVIRAPNCTWQAVFSQAATFSPCEWMLILCDCERWHVFSQNFRTMTTRMKTRQLRPRRSQQCAKLLKAVIIKFAYPLSTVAA